MKNVKVVTEVLTVEDGKQIDQAMVTWNTGPDSVFDATEHFETLKMLLGIQAAKAGKVQQPVIHPLNKFQKFLFVVAVCSVTINVFLIGGILFTLWLR
jgi:hypothetical protein